MKSGYLATYFECIAAKRLSRVEVDVELSNQHEFNGAQSLRYMLGEPSGKVQYSAKWLYLDDDNLDTTLAEENLLTWYDAREKGRKERGINRQEYRLYFKTTQTALKASEGDLLLITKNHDQSLLIIIAAKNSSVEQQLLWLFNLAHHDLKSFYLRSELNQEKDRIEFTSRLILENIGIEIKTFEESALEHILKQFPSGFPTTREFSNFARSTLTDVTPDDSCDHVLMAWMEREEMLFRTLERHLISERLAKGFILENHSTNIDVDGFISFSLSIQNRRKSRVGLALENHVEQLLKHHNIQYARTATTENKSKPDFLFPSHKAYHDMHFDSSQLTLLGVKSTCKDRWRQVLAEGDRIKKKHLLTLEPAISKQQTDEMQAKQLQLVIPKSLHATYISEQQSYLMNLEDFLSLLKNKQKSHLTI